MHYETLELDDDTAWTDEVDRSSSAYVSWVQSSLNRLDGARLAVDGISGTLTRAAVRNFQSRHGLAVDGIVGPFTEAALIAAGAGQPPGSSWAPAPPAAPSAPSKPRTPSRGGTPQINLGPNARVTPSAIEGLKAILRNAGLPSATVTSGQRTSVDQARVMFDNLDKYSTVSEQRRLYGSYGDQVIDVYEAEKAKGRSDTAIRASMQAKIEALGCSNVSHHCSDTQDVIDVSPPSIADHNAFLRALGAAKAGGQVSLYLTPADSDPAFHIEFAPTRRA